MSCSARGFWGMKDPFPTAVSLYSFPSMTLDDIGYRGMSETAKILENSVWKTLTAIGRDLIPSGMVLHGQ